MHFVFIITSKYAPEAMNTEANRAAISPIKADSGIYKAMHTANTVTHNKTFNPFFPSISLPSLRFRQITSRAHVIA